MIKFFFNLGGFLITGILNLILKNLEKFTIMTREREFCINPIAGLFRLMQPYTSWCPVKAIVYHYCIISHVKCTVKLTFRLIRSINAVVVVVAKIFIFYKIRSILTFKFADQIGWPNCIFIILNFFTLIASFDWILWVRKY